MSLRSAFRHDHTVMPDKMAIKLVYRISNSTYLIKIKLIICVKGKKYNEMKHDFFLKCYFIYKLQESLNTTERNKRIQNRGGT